MAIVKVFEQHGSWFVTELNTTGSFPAVDGSLKFNLRYAMALIEGHAVEKQPNTWSVEHNAINVASYLAFQQAGPRSQPIDGEDREELVAKEWLATQKVLSLCMHGQLPFRAGGHLDAVKLLEATDG